MPERAKPCGEHSEVFFSLSSLKIRFWWDSNSEPAGSATLPAGLAISTARPFATEQVLASGVIKRHTLFFLNDAKMANNWLWGCLDRGHTPPHHGARFLRLTSSTVAWRNYCACGGRWTPTKHPHMFLTVESLYSVRSPTTSNRIYIQLFIRMWQSNN